MELQTLKDLYIHELKDLHSAEKQIVKALPKMAKAAKSGALAAGFRQHLEQTKRHAERLEKLLADLGENTRGPKCKGMEGLLAEGDQIVTEDAAPEVRDAGLISAAQRVEHYEIAGYGTARTYALSLGYREAAKVLGTTLREEGATDKKLTTLATKSVNLKAKKPVKKKKKSLVDGARDLARKMHLG